MTGTTDLTAPIVFRVEKVGQETMMQKIVQAVMEEQSDTSSRREDYFRFRSLVVYASLIVPVVWLAAFLTASDTSPILPGGRSALGNRIAAAFRFAITVLD